MRNRTLSLVVMIGTAILLGGCSLPFKQSFAGLQINADPQSAVYLEDKHVGETNFFSDKLKPGEYVVRLSPLPDQQQTWETKIRLNEGMTSVVNRTFGASTQESSSYTLQLEKTGNKKVAEVNIVTMPENVIVRIDDQPKGFSPLTNMSLTADGHKITLSAPGHKTLSFTANPVLGHRLIITAELGKSLDLQPSTPTTPSGSPAPAPPAPSASPAPSVKPSPSPSTKPQVTELEKPYVEILTTPTGWLRVRSEPNGLVDNEVARVDSGETFKFIESNQTGWYKIEYETGKEGWIAAQFARLVK